MEFEILKQSINTHDFENEDSIDKFINNNIDIVDDEDSGGNKQLDKQGNDDFQKHNYNKVEENEVDNERKYNIENLDSSKEDNKSQGSLNDQFKDMYVKHTTRLLNSAKSRRPESRISRSIKSVSLDKTKCYEEFVCSLRGRKLSKEQFIKDFSLHDLLSINDFDNLLKNNCNLVLRDNELKTVYCHLVNQTEGLANKTESNKQLIYQSNHMEEDSNNKILSLEKVILLLLEVFLAENNEKLIDLKNNNELFKIAEMNQRENGESPLNNEIDESRKNNLDEGNYNARNSNKIDLFRNLNKEILDIIVVERKKEADLTREKDKLNYKKLNSKGYFYKKFETNSANKFEYPRNNSVVNDQMKNDKLENNRNTTRPSKAFGLLRTNTYLSPWVDTTNLLSKLNSTSNDDKSITLQSNAFVKMNKNFNRTFQSDMNIAMGNKGKKLSKLEVTNNQLFFDEKSKGRKSNNLNNLMEPEKRISNNKSIIGSQNKLSDLNLNNVNIKHDNKNKHEQISNYSIKELEDNDSNKSSRNDLNFIREHKHNTKKSTFNKTNALNKDLDNTHTNELLNKHNKHLKITNSNSPLKSSTDGIKERGPVMAKMSPIARFHNMIKKTGHSDYLKNNTTLISSNKTKSSIDVFSSIQSHKHSSTPLSYNQNSSNAIALFAQTINANNNDDIYKLKLKQESQKESPVYDYRTAMFLRMQEVKARIEKEEKYISNSIKERNNDILRDVNEEIKLLNFYHKERGEKITYSIFTKPLTNQKVVKRESESTITEFTIKNFFILFKRTMKSLTLESERKKLNNFEEINQKYLELKVDGYEKKTNERLEDIKKILIQLLKIKCKLESQSKILYEKTDIEDSVVLEHLQMFLNK